MKTDNKTVKKKAETIRKAEPVRPADEGITIGSFGFNVLGLRVSVEKVNIRRAGTMIRQPEVIACQTTQKASQHRK